MKKTLLATSIMALFSSSSSLRATEIVHTGLDGNRSQSIEIKADGNTRNVGAGVGILLVDGITYIDVLCVNLFQGITLNIDYAAQSIAASVYDSDGPAAGYLAQTYLPSVSTKIAGAALQLAVWDLIHDGGDGFSAGRVQSTVNTNSSVLTQANSFRQEALGKAAAASVFTAAPGARAFQQQIYLAGNPGQVPEPATFALLGIGLVGAALIRRRQAK